LEGKRKGRRKVLIVAVEDKQRVRGKRRVSKKGKSKPSPAMPIIPRDRERCGRSPKKTSTEESLYTMSLTSREGE